MGLSQGTFLHRLKGKRGEGTPTELRQKKGKTQNLENSNRGTPAEKLGRSLKSLGGALTRKIHREEIQV